MWRTTFFWSLSISSRSRVKRALFCLLSRSTGCTFHFYLGPILFKRKSCSICFKKQSQELVHVKCSLWWLLFPFHFSISWLLDSGNTISSCFLLQANARSKEDKKGSSNTLYFPEFLLEKQGPGGLIACRLLFTLASYCKAKGWECSDPSSDCQQQRVFLARKGSRLQCLK